MNLNLYMVLLGCKPAGRYTEQHDLFFGIGEKINALKSDMVKFWPEAKGKLHIDAWRQVSVVDNFHVAVEDRAHAAVENDYKLFFVNLGGYRGQDFEEYHYKQLVVARDMKEATKKAKTSAFFQEHISPHVDDKYGLDVDDIFTVEDALSPSAREKYRIVLRPVTDESADEVNIGYVKFSEL
ncbi:DUF1543 domain-containing protein [Sphingobacterium oryzagri]|uniref:DUF1543 domain-containing protein n=1 Tax=Sphingobacterium oryzagri TaxID=3025669 RepID=A0ABY7WKJ7_9SPHI|nr:DUF1543 domain-containing protein [Sphingobacterium sp. KACC 22765]WDF70127.1 DUF1543 domain-containing protein [Sphingobacterium sp. KACC 22765]